mmetsp:Transcript_50083/g.150752  ORF Transcript_50083/g.150752 Transcript_50083/m.150752 type:complete len:409 (-) Transcript_50083:1043-2269(-)
MGCDRKGLALVAGALFCLSVVLSQFRSRFTLRKYHGHLDFPVKETTASHQVGTGGQWPRKRLRGHAVWKLFGQLGNHIQILAYARAVQIIASDEFNVDLTLHFRGQQSSDGRLRRQAKSAASDAWCLFPVVRRFDLHECNTIECSSLIKRQTNLIAEGAFGEDKDALVLPPSNATIIRETLRRYVGILEGSNTTNATMLPMPFLYTNERRNIGSDLLDELIDVGIRDFFKISDQCCAAMPDADEYVFHHRSFKSDLPKIHREFGGEELEPSRVATDLMGHLPEGTKVALLSRSWDGDEVQQYVDAMRSRNFTVRRILGQSGVQDFCFLLKARAGIFGTGRSSYLMWASILSRDVRNVTLYRVNSSSHQVVSSGYSWRNARLANRFHYPIFTESSESNKQQNESRLLSI